MVDNIAENAEFSEILDEALSAAKSLRHGVESLAESISAEPKELLNKSHLFENRIAQARPAMDRLVDILKNAKHHTLESAYHIMVSDGAKPDDLVKMREIIREYRYARIVITSSERQISEMLSGVEVSPWETPIDLRSIRKSGDIIAEA